MRQISDNFYNKLYKIYKSSGLYSPITIRKSFHKYKIEGKQSDNNNNSHKKNKIRILPKIKNNNIKGKK